jgi:hypothetical protein
MKSAMRGADQKGALLRALYQTATLASGFRRVGSSPDLCTLPLPLSKLGSLSWLSLGSRARRADCQTRFICCALSEKSPDNTCHFVGESSGNDLEGAPRQNGS